MKISALSPAELRRRLRSPGLYFRTGVFTACLRTRLEEVASTFALLYGDYPLVDGPYADFHLELAPPRGLRRWIRPQVAFHFDGEAPFKPLPRNQAFAMFEWGLNWCVSSLANHYLIIHAAVIEKNGRAAILPAPPGSGKSTLCAVLIRHGWRLLSDELALVRRSDFRLMPLPRPVSLKNASIDVMKRHAPDAVFSPSVSDTVKGTVAQMKAPAASIARADETALPGWVVFPRYEGGTPLTLTPVPRTRAFMRVADNAFNYAQLGAEAFEALAGVIAQSDCYDFRYSDIDEAVAAFEQLSMQGGPP
ncbi:MAG: HprK-related kinase A [Noviherbaspirillum sp.]